MPSPVFGRYLQHHTDLKHSCCPAHQEHLPGFHSNFLRGIWVEYFVFLQLNCCLHAETVLPGRQKCVCEPQRLGAPFCSYGVPQGSGFGPPGFHLDMHGIYFQFYANGSQILVKKKDELPIWNHFRHVLETLNPNLFKTKWTDKRSDGVCPPADLGPLTHFMKPVVSNLGFKMDRDFKLEEQKQKSIFFHLMLLAKVKLSGTKALWNSNPYLHHISAGLLWCTLLWVSQSSLPRLQLVPNAAAHVLTGARRPSLFIPFCLFMFFRFLNVLALPYLSELLHSCLRSADQLLQEVPGSRRTGAPAHFRQTSSLSLSFNPAWMRLI